MKLEFYKYQATGNDFVIVDNRNLAFPKSDQAFIAKLCDRRFGIGADGLILLEPSSDLAFTMVYFNADGCESSMCGNGGRSIVAFAKFLGLMGLECEFHAPDGKHRAALVKDMVSLEMSDVTSVNRHKDSSFLDTGSPHHVSVVEDLEAVNVVDQGRKIRNEVYGPKGSNVNFVSVLDSQRIGVRTYERGVEDETLSCGTGVTASVLALFDAGALSSKRVLVETRGGILKVEFEENGQGGYTNIRLIGPARQVFQGSWTND